MLHESSRLVAKIRVQVAISACIALQPNKFQLRSKGASRVTGYCISFRLYSFSKDEAAGLKKLVSFPFLPTKSFKEAHSAASTPKLQDLLSDTLFLVSLCSQV